MASTVYTDFTTPAVNAAWLNDVNALTYLVPGAGYTPNMGISRLYGYVTITEYGGDPTGVANSDVAVSAAVASGKRVIVNGKFLITAPVQPTQAGLVGYGPDVSGFICVGCHGIEIPSAAGYNRPAALLTGFSVDSSANSCDDKFAFYIPGVAGGAAAVYNSGLTIRDVEVGRVGRMGGGIYAKDIFRLNVEDVGFTDVCWMVRVVGSVVQAKFVRLTSNNDSATLPGGGTLVTQKYGVSTETASYSSGTLAPENVRFIDCSYIRGGRGISHTAGLDVEFVNFDTEADVYGALLNAACTLKGGILAPGIAAAAWVGIFRGVSIADPDDATIIDGVDINCLRSPSTPASSYGMDIGDGVSPVHGLVVRNLRVRGLAASLQSAIRARILNGDGVFYSNKIRSSVCASTEVDIQSGRTIVFEDNLVPSGIISINDAGDTAAGGRIINNTATTLTTTLSSDNWTIYNPGISGGNTRGVGEFRSTFTGTLTGCTTSPTGTLRYVTHGRVVTLFFPLISGTSNATSATITGLPAALWPNREQNLWGSITDNGNSGFGAFRMKTTGVIEFYVGTNYANFTAAGTKAVNPSTITYSLD